SVLWAMVPCGELREPLPRIEGCGPLMLLFVQFLEIDKRKLVLRIEAEYFVKRIERAVDKATPPVIECQAEHGVRMLQLAQAGPLQQVLVHRNGLADLALFPVQVAEDHVHLEPGRIQPRRAREFIDREIDLVGHEKVETEHVVRRFTALAAIDPASILELVPLPRFSDRQPHEQRDECRQERCVAAHTRWPRYSSSTDSQAPCARRISSISSRAAPQPPGAWLTQCTRARTSGAASAGAAARPTRLSTGRSTM